MSRPLAVFDLDGTLVDSSGDLGSAVNAMLAELQPGIPPLAPDTVRSFVGNGAAVLVRRSLDAAGLTTATEHALPVFLEAYRSRLLDSTRLYPGIREALDGLAGTDLAVLTNKPGDFSRAILHGLGVADRFRLVWGPGDAGVRKPDPAGLRRLVAACGARDAETVMIGDSGIDVATARAAGIAVLGVTWGFDPGSLATDAPDATVDTPAGLVEALGRLVAAAR